MRPGTLTLLIVASTLFLPRVLAAGTDDAVTEMYSGTTNLPDSHGYRGFLHVIESAALRPGHNLHVMESALGIDVDTEEGEKHAAAQYEWFLAGSKAAREESKNLRVQTLCPRNWAEMSFKEIQTARYALNDAEDRLYGEYFNAALDHLSSAEKATFLEYMNDFKKGVSFTRVDAEKWYGDRAESKARSYQASVCATQSSSSGT